MTLEALRAADMLARDGISAGLIDVCSFRPLDESAILDSVRRTGRLAVADTGRRTVGLCAELVARRNFWGRSRGFGGE